MISQYTNVGVEARAGMTTPGGTGRSWWLRGRYWLLSACAALAMLSSASGVAQENLCAGEARPVPDRAIAFRRSDAILFDVGKRGRAAVAIRLIQQGIDVRWARVGGDGYIDGPTRGVGSELTAGQWSNESQICVWSEDTDNLSGSIALEFLAAHDEPTRQALALRSDADAAVDATPGDRQRLYATSAGMLAAVGLPTLAAESWLAAGRIAKDNFKHPAAIEWLRRAAEAFRKADHVDLAGWAELWLSSVRATQGDIAAARDLCLVSLKSGARYPVTLRAELENFVGLMFHSEGSLREAIRWYGKALETIGPDWTGIVHSKVLNNLGGYHYVRGEMLEAAPLFEKSAAICMALGNRSQTIGALTNTGLAYSAMGEYEIALAQLVRAIELEPRPGYERGDLLAAIGTALAALGDIEKAAEQYGQSLKDAEFTGDIRVSAWRARALAALQTENGNSRQAVALLTAAMQKFGESEDLRATVRTGCDLGRAYLASGDSAAAANLLGRLQPMIDKIQDEGLKPLLACLTELEARVAAAAADYATADDRLEAATRHYTAVQDRVRLLQVMAMRASIALKKNEQSKALNILAEAEAVAAATLEGMVRGERRRVYLDSTRRLLDLRVEALLLDNADERQAAAFSISASTRGQVLQAMLAEAGKRREPDTSETMRRRRLAALVAHKTALLNRGDPENELPQLLLDIAALGAPYEARETNHMTPRHEVRLPSLQSRLGRNDLMLYFHLADEWGRLWAIGHDEVTVHVLPGEAELAPLVDAVRRQWMRADSRVRQTVSTRPDQELASRLLSPVAEQLSDRRVLIVADRALHSVPFAAFPVPDRDDTVRLVEIASSVNLLRPGGAASGAVRADSAVVLVQGDTVSKDDELPGTKHEARWIIDQFGADRVVVAGGAVLSPARLQSLLAQPASVLHIGTHAFAHTTEPALSAILFGASPVPNSDYGTPGQLTAVEIAGMAIGQRLIVLAACETGLGRVSATGGQMSLSQAFMEAGASEVVSTLWRVPDPAVARFSSAFYAALVHEETTIAQALRSAQLSLLRDRKWRQPLFWAGFVLTAAPRAE